MSSLLLVVCVVYYMLSDSLVAATFCGRGFSELLFCLGNNILWEMLHRGWSIAVLEVVASQLAPA